MKLVRGIDSRVRKFARTARGVLRGRRIFCISMQRSGTTSVGVFFKEQGYDVAPNPMSKLNGWTNCWFRGDYEAIFRSPDFRSRQVFEDDPWWCGDFYKVLFHRFPDARFVLIDRDPGRWFDSMMAHSDGRNPGNSYRHAHIYHRLGDFYASAQHRALMSNAFTSVADGGLSLGEENREHYERWYVHRNRAVREFFAVNDARRLFTGRLEDPDVWSNLGKHFGIDVQPGHVVHANKSAIPGVSRRGPQ